MAEPPADQKPGSGDHTVPYCSYGFQYIRKSWLAMGREAEGARKGTDPEHVHRMRVASRRLRAAMPVFKSCFPEKKYRKWLKEMKNITTSLGDARDLDVQIGFLESYLHELGKALPGSGSSGILQGGGSGDASALLLLLQQKRERIQPSVEAAVISLQKGGIFEGFGDILTASRSGGGGTRTPGILYRRAQRKINSRIDDLLNFERAVHDPDAVARHHEMRIAAKRLRYTLEAFNRLYSGELKKPIKRVRALQDILGKMHDCDVWIGCLPGFIGEPPGVESGRVPGGHIPDKDLPGIPGLLEDRKQERTRLYGAFVEMWDDLREARFFELLQELISRQPGDSP